MPPRTPPPQPPRGFQGVIRPVALDVLADELSELIERDRALEPLRDIVSSLRAAALPELTAQLSDRDLVVSRRSRPAPRPDVVRVRAGGPVGLPRPGEVVIEHLSASSVLDEICCPAAQALAMFWRVVASKFAVETPPGLPSLDVPWRYT